MKQVLNSQQNPMGNTEISYISPPPRRYIQSPLLSTSATRVLHSLQLMNLQWHIILHVGFPGGSVVKRTHLPMQEMQVRSLGLEDPLEKEMATYSSILAWEIPWTKEPGRLKPMWLQRVRYDLATKQQGAQCTLSFILGAYPVGLYQTKYFNCPKNLHQFTTPLPTIPW